MLVLVDSDPFHGADDLAQFRFSATTIRGKSIFVSAVSPPMSLEARRRPRHGLLSPMPLRRQSRRADGQLGADVSRDLGPTAGAPDTAKKRGG